MRDDNQAKIGKRYFSSLGHKVSVINRIPPEEDVLVEFIDGPWAGQRRTYRSDLLSETKEIPAETTNA